MKSDKGANPSAGTQMVTLNHWIPFTEDEVDAPDCFASHFMTNFMAGKTNAETTKTDQQTELQFFDNQHESSQMNHELKQESLMENSCEIHDNSCEKDKTDNSCIKDFISPQAKVVMDVGREVWRYYMQQAKTVLPSAGTQMATMKTWNVDASLYDIKVWFKGRDEKGRMNASSTDERFNTMMDDLRDKLNALAKAIETKVYEYGFLK